MQYNAPTIKQVRTQTNASLRDCLDALARANGDAVQAIILLHEQQARALAEQTSVSIASCLHAVQITFGDLDQAQRYLRATQQRVSDDLPLNMAAERLIYISVSGYPVQIWRPVEAAHVHELCYRIISVNPDPEHQYWQFEGGDIVRCTLHTFAEHEVGLIATARCEHTP